MIELVQCARCNATRPYSLTGMCQKCGFQGFKKLSAIEEHGSWPVYQAKRFHWQESLRQAKDAYRNMAAVQKELAQVCVAIGVEFGDALDDRALGDVPNDDAADVLLAENIGLRRKLQECIAERDNLKNVSIDFYETVKKISGIT